MTLLQSAGETFALGEKIGQSLKTPCIIALKGNLGAGKTTLVQGIGKGMGVKEEIQSPTFVYCNAYQTTHLPLVHFDLYRLKEIKEVLALGIEESLEQEAIIAIEWPEIAASLLPCNTLWIELIHDNEKRKALFSGQLPCPF